MRFVIGNPASRLQYGPVWYNHQPVAAAGLDPAAGFARDPLRDFAKVRGQSVGASVRIVWRMSVVV